MSSQQTNERKWVNNWMEKHDKHVWMQTRLETHSPALHTVTRIKITLFSFAQSSTFPKKTSSDSLLHSFSNKHCCRKKPYNPLTINVLCLALLPFRYYLLQCRMHRRGSGLSHYSFKTLHFLFPD